MDRLTSMGISNDAQDFLEAARIVRGQKSASFFQPLYFLACQSIELSMKGFLRGSGLSEKELRSIGHNLKKCLEAANAHGLQDRVRLSEADVEAIVVVNPYYQYKDFQYSIAGYKSLPVIDSLMELAERMWEALRPFCEEHREYHFGKPTAIV